MTTATVPAAFTSPAGVIVDRDVVTASGPDTDTFLQGQLSQDIVALESGASAWSLLLSPQGKVEAWLRVTRTGENALVMDVDAGVGQSMLERLGRFKLRTKCDLALEHWEALAVRWALDASAPDLANAPASALVAQAEWPGVNGVDLLAPEFAPDAITALDVAEATLADYEALRIACGVPAMATELADGAIAAEAGIVERSVSFTKGCYTGQELVARIDSRGNNVAKRLVGVVALDPRGMLISGEPVLVDGAEVGAVTSAAGNIGLAYLKRSVDSLPVEAAVGDTPAVLQNLPLVSR